MSIVPILLTVMFRWRSSVGRRRSNVTGKLLIIDGGFSKAYQGKTGIAGYTLVANSHGMNLVEHRPFVSAEDAIRNETDMVSDNILIETAKRRILVADTDIGRELKESIGHLEKLLNAYRDGILIEKGI